MTGKLWGVGVGPGDPKLLTLRAVEVLRAADVVAFHSAPHGRSVARDIAAGHISPGQTEVHLVYPVTTGRTGHPGGYDAALAEFYDSATARLAAHLDAGRDVAVLAEGDPTLFSSYMHLHARLAPRYPSEIVPGVTSVAGAAAALGRTLVEGRQVLSVIPATLPEPELEAALAAADAAAVLKLGRRQLPKVRAALEAQGRLGGAWYVERATTAQQEVRPLGEVDPGTVPYLALALVPGDGRRDGERETAARRPEVVVVGLGPGDPGWLTPEARAALADADDLVGYGPYLDRVPAAPRQRRHPSDNRVERERAEFALRLAGQGARVAVVSSGDPGVFAMAAAVYEVASEQPGRDVDIRVVPGLTAAQAVASRVGAPLGHDYCVISLSDRLKPWAIIEQRLLAAAGADLVIALYNPASRARRHQLADARRALLTSRKPSTPVVVGRDVGGPEESVTVTTLGELDVDSVDMRCMLLVGSSKTRAFRRPGGRWAVFTPRHYETS
ncbi:precorrin-3B C(17)-methyltransferase [Symbioplanes lichenis]|uniref:precorrin-3B C(17)-methyltransferase n=1 Tax=Symbioplanes lichenis TaxID=1629072 RepID=UPI00273986C1|nr:precorrin-3B C(17)-methyltransferase [Actinoplanes lichenis]